MAGSSLLVLIDDIATVLDDVTAMTKVAAHKTSGVLGDDLALNAQQVTGVRADRELPVVWAVAKGSIKNKLILVPAALIISALAPWAVMPLLMIGGLFLCYEGFEKLAHNFLHAGGERAAHEAELHQALVDETIDMVALERDKIKGAVRTDFILSAEIIVITLGVVANMNFMTQVGVLAGIAVIMTIGVYGLVAGIVKLDDAGIYLSKRPGQGSLAGMQRWFGDVILVAAPYMMKSLSVIGMAAMFMVGGGILVHGIPAAHHFVAHAAELIHAVGTAGPALAVLTSMLLNALIGVAAGAITLAIVYGGSRLWKLCGYSLRASSSEK